MVCPVRLLFALALICATSLTNPLRSQSVGISSSSRLKENLDLPFDAIGESSEEEDAPELIVFYGQAYEATDVVFVLDESLTMGREGRFDIMKREARRAIAELNPRSLFGVVFYGGQVTNFRRSLVDATSRYKQAAQRFVQSRQRNLGTCLGNAVVEALRMLASEGSRHSAVILISDGTPTRCPFTPAGSCAGRRNVVESVLAQIQQANTQRIAVHTILVGQEDRCSELAPEFMRRVASESGGSFRELPR